MRFVILTIALISAIFAKPECGSGLGKCSSGKCCSKWGYCGTKDEYCLLSKGCQAKYGKCKGSSGSSSDDDDDDHHHSSSGSGGETNKKTDEKPNKGTNINPGGEKMERFDTEKPIWNYLMKKLGNKYAAAGMMGNLYAESRLQPADLEKRFEKSLGMDDKTYTRKVDDGSYKNFVNDKAGYGLVQWTYKTRKEKLLNYARSVGKSIGDLNMQLDFFFKELSEKYPKILEKIRKAKSVKEASDVIVLEYEIPQDHSSRVCELRANYGRFYYNIF